MRGTGIVWGTAALLFFLLLPAAAAAQKPKTIAILPVVFTTRYSPVMEKTLADALAHKFRYPLNDLVKMYAYVPPAEIVETDPAFKRPCIMDRFERERMKRLADRLRADLVAAVVVTNYSERVYWSFWRDDETLITRVALRFVAYDRLKDKYLDLSDYENYRNTNRPEGTGPYLARDIVFKLLQKVKLVRAGDGVIE